MPREVTAFECECHGTAFPTLQACQAHEADVAFHRFLDEELRIGHGGEWSADMVADALLERAADVVRLLTAARPERF